MPARGAAGREPPPPVALRCFFVGPCSRLAAAAARRGCFMPLFCKREE